jgi:hypothetical protein
METRHIYFRVSFFCTFQATGLRAGCGSGEKPDVSAIGTTFAETTNRFRLERAVRRDG